MTIREFAQTIGVSPSTVSRAMHGRGRISSQTRQLVLDQARHLGFTPNLNAQRLSVGRAQTIALDFGVWRDYLADMFLVEIARGIRDQLDACGYGLLLAGPGDLMGRWVRSRAVDGVIVVGEQPGARLAADIATTSTPCVVIGNKGADPCPGVTSVVVGLADGARQVAQLLIAHGHRHIGFIGSGAEDQLLPAFREELVRLGAALPDGNVATLGPTPRDGAAALCDVMSQSSPPTAIFARTDAVAAGAVLAAHRMGIRIPEDLSIVGHDDVPVAELTEPPLTTVRVDCAEIARLSVDAVFALLEEPGLVLERRVVQTRLVVRGTVSAPCPPGRHCGARERSGGDAGHGAREAQSSRATGRTGGL